MVFLIQLRGAFFQSARAESCTFPILTISSPFEPGLTLPASQRASHSHGAFAEAAVAHVENMLNLAGHVVVKKQAVYLREHEVTAPGLTAQSARRGDYSP